MRLILVRHGQPQVPDAGPRGNPPLSPRGHEQARHVGAKLQQERIDRILSSGMQRADATAQPLADALGLPVEIHADLGEVDRWGGDYHSIEMIRQKGRDEWQTFLENPLEYFGVDADRFRNETLAAFRAVVETAGDDHIAIFTHGFPINIMLAHILGIDHDARFVPFYGSVSRIAGKSFDGLVVVSVNESGHIPEVLR